MRNTRQRREILQQLRNTKKHPTAQELHELVRRVLPNISLGTVYRNLQRLVAAGEIRALKAGGRTRFDGDTAPHTHVRCVQCGRVADAPAPELTIHAPTGPEVEGFTIVGYQLEWLAICRQCAAKSQDRLSQQAQ